jgi:hypothetical protein
MKQSVYHETMEQKACFQVERYAFLYIAKHKYKLIYMISEKLTYCKVMFTIVCLSLREILYNIVH